MRPCKHFCFNKNKAHHGDFISNFSPQFTELNICFVFYTNIYIYISAFILIIVILSFNYLASSIVEYQEKLA